MDALAIKPMGDFLLLKEEKEQISNSRLALPNVGDETPLKCKVIAVGEGRFSEWQWKIIPMRYKVDDIVLSPAMGGRKVKVGNMSDNYILIGQDNIMAIIDEK
jgi:co-chaperonin GroES (HSP10)